MSSIILKNVSINYPVFGASEQSLKKTFINKGLGALLSRKKNKTLYSNALNNICLTLSNGDRIGIIGSNGSGKSTLLKVLANIYKPTEGIIKHSGKISPIFDIHLGMNFDATGYENIFLRGMFMGYKKHEIITKIDSIIAFSDLDSYIHLPVNTYSDGMKLRLSFSVSTAFDAEILLMDESILAGDANFINKARIRLESFISNSNILALASHSEEIVKCFCNKTIWLHKGNIMKFGLTNEVFHDYNSFLNTQK